jgi:hypothetical protein
MLEWAKSSFAVPTTENQVHCGFERTATRVKTDTQRQGLAGKKKETVDWPDKKTKQISAIDEWQRGVEILGMWRSCRTTASLLFPARQCPSVGINGTEEAKIPPGRAAEADSSALHPEKRGERRVLYSPVAAVKTPYSRPLQQRATSESTDKAQWGTRGNGWSRWEFQQLFGCPCLG